MVPTPGAQEVPPRYGDVEECKCNANPRLSPGIGDQPKLGRKEVFNAFTGVMGLGLAIAVPLWPDTPGSSCWGGQWIAQVCAEGCSKASL